MDTVAKIHKAIADVVIVVSAICGAGSFVESEFEHLIEKTKTVISDVMKPGVVGGLGPQHLASIAKTQKSFQNIENTPSLSNLLTPSQREQVRSIITDFSKIDYSKLATLQPSEPDTKAKTAGPTSPAE